MKTKHTPGEWNAKDSEVYSLITGNTIARCDIGGKDETTEANAKLIACAPELLKELQRVSEQARTFLQSDSFGLIKKKDFNQQAKNRLGAIIETAEAAIQKATGHEAN